MEQQLPIDIRDLLSAIEQESRTAGPKVTIYFSVPHSSDYAILGRAELKADVQSAAERLKALHTPEALRADILAKLQSLLHTDALWEHRSESYAIFASASFLRYYALPIPVQDNLWVNNDFQITPLIPLLSLPEHFYLLEVSLGFPRMVRVHPQFSVPVPLREVWEREAVIESAEPIHGRSFHTASGPGGEHHGGMIPHGASLDSRYRERHHQLTLLAHVVDKLLTRATEPLVLTGASEVVEQLRPYLHYKHVLVSAERIPLPSGNPIDVNTHSWQACTDLYRTRNESAGGITEELDALRAAGRVTEDLNEILSFSATGKVKTLIVNDNALASQSFDGSNFDMLNAALILTLRHHGTARESNTLHSPTGVAALLRPGVRI